MFFQQLVNGLTLGSAYAVIAIGYTLVFGVLNIVNMAHGGIFMIGAYIGLLLVIKSIINLKLLRVILIECLIMIFWIL